MKKKTKDSNKIFALYDEEDRPLGCYDREQLRDLLKISSRNFDCTVSWLRTGRRNGINYKGKRYIVYIYEEEEEQTIEKRERI